MTDEFARCPHGRYASTCELCLPPGVTVARQLFARLVRDSNDKIDRLQAVAMVAQMLKRSTLDVGFDIGLYEIHNWHPKLPDKTQ